MAPHLNFILASILLLGTQISAAPLNDRDNGLQRRNPEDGWGCQYDGPANSGMNPSLDLPGMVAGLCAKVNYHFDGCENFKPDHAGGKSGQGHRNSDNSDDPSGSSSPLAGLPGSGDCPLSRWNSALSLCTDISIGGGDPSPDPSNDGSPDDGQENPEKSDANQGHHPSPVKKHGHKKPTESDEPDDDDDGRAYSQSVDGPEQDEQPDNGGDENHSKSKANHNPHHKSSKKPEKKLHDEEHGEHHSPKHHDNDKKKSPCHVHERWSSTVDCCVDNSFFSKPNDDNTCKKGDFDSTINLCLDATLLGGLQNSPLGSDSQPVLSNASSVGQGVKADSKLGASGHRCPANHQYSSLISACVDAKLLTQPTSGDNCGSGQLDLLIGLCLDVSASVKVPGVIDAKSHSHVEA